MAFTLLPSRFFCADGSSSSSATLFYNSLPGAVKHLFHSGYMFPQVPRRTRSSCHARACECTRFVRACLWLCARRVSHTVPWVRVMPIDVQPCVLRQEHLMAFFATAWTIACITYGSAVPSGAQRHSSAARWLAAASAT